MENQSDSVSTGPPHSIHKAAQYDSADSGQSTGQVEAVSVHGPLSCKCVTGEDEYQVQGSTMGMAYNSKLTLVASASRPRPLTFSHDISSRGRSPHRTPSSPECTSQRSPLQAQSPASFIFERSVQEDILIPQTSPSIPSHIRTDNHIPPVLEASSVAITDKGLDPDLVEIVTHAIHHPAINGVPAEQSLHSPSLDNVASDLANIEGLPLDSQSSEGTDIRRLSFISFADVVNAENAETSENTPRNAPQKGATSPTTPEMVYYNVSPSPLYSPVPSHGLGASPPTSISTSFKGLDLSPTRGLRGAEGSRAAIKRSASPSTGGDLNIETMRQALRRTGSGDLGATRGQLSHTGLTVNKSLDS
ncbi:hypothetical protein BJX70DRAFT_383548 [Aspergillus crustosus]